MRLGQRGVPVVLGIPGRCRGWNVATAVLLLACCVSLMAIPVRVSAQSFGVGVTFDLPAGVGPVSVAIGDVNGDGWADLVVANYGGTNTVSVLLGTGAGGFGPKTDFATGLSPFSVAIGDVNGDGRPDLAVANQNSNTVSVLPGDGAGGFGTKSDFATGADPLSVAIGDVNGDGRPDLVVANYSSNTVSVLLRTAAGGFEAHTDFATGTGPKSVAIADLNGDGKPDLAVANQNSSTVSVLLGNGWGGFGAKTDFPTGSAPTLVAIGDLSGDGRADLAVANDISGTLSVLLGTGAGGFGAKTDFTTGARPQSLAIGDVNNDGKPDLATANWFSATVSVLLGNGAGGFGAKTDFATGANPYSVAIGDVNGDGRSDMAVASSGSNTVTVLLGSGAGGFGSKTDYATGLNAQAVAIGDVSGDGQPDLVVTNSYGTVGVRMGNGAGVFGGMTTFATGSNPYSVAIGDLNGDGKTDLAVANASSNTVSVLLGTGGGGFGAKTDFATGTTPMSVAIGDLTGDGKPDLAVGNNFSTTVSVLPGNGDGTFGAKRDLLPANYARAVAIGDLNGDGLLDLAVAGGSTNTVAVLLGTGAGGFGTATNFATGAGAISVAIGDLNGDGKPDLAVASTSDTTVSVLLGNGAGVFGAKSDFTTGTNPVSVVIGDVNGDGRPDLAVANYGSNSASVLLGNGAGAFGTRTDFATGTNPFGVAIGDVNGDGRTDMAVSNPGSNTVSVFLGLTRTRTALAVSAGSSVLATPLTLTATVSVPAPGSGTPTGTVRFLDGTRQLGAAATVTAGVATLTGVTGSDLGPGLSSLTAVYAGDGKFFGSLSAAQPEMVYVCAGTPSAAASSHALAPGAAVDIACTGLPNVQSVKFGGVASTSFTWTQTSFVADAPAGIIRAVVPSGALSGPVTVANLCGVATDAASAEVAKSCQLQTAASSRYELLTAVAVPLTPTLADQSGVPLADLALPGTVDYDWRVGTWDAASQRYVTPTRLAPGHGYWIQTRAAWSRSLTGSALPNTTLDIAIAQQGWYQLGNPFTLPVLVSSLNVRKSGVTTPFLDAGQVDLQSTVYTWNATAAVYEPASTIPSGAMFWVRKATVSTPVNLLIAAPTSPAPAGPAAGSRPGLDWQVRLSARQGEWRTAEVRVGVAALTGGRAHPLTAMAAPPPPGERLSLVVDSRGEGVQAGGYLCAIADRAQLPAWELVIDHAEAPGEIEIEVAAEGLPGNLRLVLRDAASGDAAEVVTGRPVTLAALGATRRLRLEALPLGTAPLAAAEERIRPYPNPFGATTGFFFTLGQSADLRVELYDLSGRQMRALERRAAPAGEHVLTWDGTDAHGAPVPAGVYFARCNLRDRRQVVRVVRFR